MPGSPGSLQTRATRASFVSWPFLIILASIPWLTSSCGGGEDGGGHPLDASTVLEASVEAAADSSIEAEPPCVPSTCADLGATCGSAPDGCGSKVECGDCEQGQHCGGGGTNKCGTDACHPKSCVQLDAQCGWASDGCSKAIDCGVCAPPETCGGSGQLNACGCTKKTCSQLGANCGSLPDGCSGIVNCGSCDEGQNCGGGGQNVCGISECMPKTCSQLMASCGLVSDVCSEVLDCGSCADPDACGGGGKLNQCGCTPKTCEQLGANCGTIDTGCGVGSCGDCLTPETCAGSGIANQCGKGEDLGCGEDLLYEGESYPTVLLGTQCWFAKNLNVGTMLENVGDMPDPTNGIVEKWCYGDQASRCNMYGGLYSWREAMGDDLTPGVRGICPMGWHIPTDEEYNELERWVLERIASPHPQYTCNTNQYAQRRCADNSGTDEGGEFGVARSLRKIGTGKGVGTADGLTDFALVGGGGRSWAGTVYYSPYRTYLWTSTIQVGGGERPLARETREEYSTFGSRTGWQDVEGLSVRCIQDLLAPDAPMSITK